MSGYSIIELMIGLAVGTFIIIGSIFLFAASSQSNHDLLVSTRLDHELRTALSLMSEDIRRAGYSSASTNDIGKGTNTNNFMAAGIDINTPTSSCILFAYDKDETGILPALNTTPSDGRFGYRLLNNAIQLRPLSSSLFNCTANDWDNLTDPGLIEITNLNFVITPTVLTLTNGTSTLTIRDVTITVTGQLTQDNSVSRTLSENIRVRNDKYSP